MYAYFDVDEPTLLRIRRADQRRTNSVSQRGQVPVMMGLQGEEGFPHQGTINFVNNQVNPMTGSITWRGVFPNPKPADWLSPIVPWHVRAHAVADWPAASGRPGYRLGGVADQGLKFVYVVDAKNTVQYRRITTGPLGK